MTTSIRTPRHKIVAAEVRAALGRAGKKQGDLAERLGISNAAASELCRGIVPFSLDRLDDIALWLDIRIVDLLGDHSPEVTERRLKTGWRHRKALRRTAALTVVRDPEPMGVAA